MRIPKRFSRFPSSREKKSKIERIKSKITELEKQGNNEKKMIVLRKLYADALMKEINKKIKHTSITDDELPELFKMFEVLKKEMTKILKGKKDPLFELEDELRLDGYNKIKEKILKIKEENEAKNKKALKFREFIWGRADDYFRKNKDKNMYRQVDRGRSFVFLKKDGEVYVLFKDSKSGDVFQNRKGERKGEIKGLNTDEIKKEQIVEIMEEREKIEKGVKEFYSTENSNHETIDSLSKKEINKENAEDSLASLSHLALTEMDFLMRNYIDATSVINDAIPFLRGDKKRIAFFLKSQINVKLDLSNAIDVLNKKLINDGLGALTETEVKYFLKVLLKRNERLGTEESIERINSFINNFIKSEKFYLIPLCIGSLLEIKDKQFEKLLSDPCEVNDSIERLEQIINFFDAFRGKDLIVFDGEHIKKRKNEVFHVIDNKFEELKHNPQKENIEKIVVLKNNLDRFCKVFGKGGEKLNEKIGDFLKEKENNAFRTILEVNLDNMANAFDMIKLIQSEKKLTNQEINSFLEKVNVKNLNYDQKRELSNFLDEIVLISENRKDAIDKLSSLKDALDNDCDQKWKIVRKYFFEHPEKVKFDKAMDGENYYVKAGRDIYKVGKPLGSGALGKTKLCQNEKGEQFAIKVEGIPQGDMVDRAMLEKRREFEFMKEMKQGIAQAFVIGAGTFRNKDAMGKIVSKDTEAKSFTVMKFYGGGDLTHKLEKEIETTEKLKLAIKVAENIKKCHDKGIVHYDIKPDNIMLTQNEDIELIDYGSAGRVSDQPKQGTSVYMPKDTPKNNYSYDEYAFLVMLAKDFKLFNPPDSVKQEIRKRYFYPRYADKFCQEKYQVTLGHLKDILFQQGTSIELRKIIWKEEVRKNRPEIDEKELDKMYEATGLADLSRAQLEDILSNHVDQKIAEKKVWDFDGVVDFGDFLDEQNRPNMQAMIEVLKQKRDELAPNASREESVLAEDESLLEKKPSITPLQKLTEPRPGVSMSRPSPTTSLSKFGAGKRSSVALTLGFDSQKESKKIKSSQTSDSPPPPKKPTSGGSG